jgi:hypothetical protein
VSTLPVRAASNAIMACAQAAVKPNIVHYYVGEQRI